MRKFVGLTALAIVASGSALAQSGPPASPPAGTSPTVQRQPNTTGNDRDVVVSRGRTGAGTVTTDSAAGGNAGHPERAVPNGSSNGGGGGR